ncbi:MAG: hypothetical protein MJ177_01285 [Clostridia bacterium]|nr:hypothetical protein [Clostridia bacterium]
MKKLISIILAVTILALCASCGGQKPSVANTDSDNTVDIDIKESNYVTYINEIYTNTNSYIGDTIKIEGMFSAETYGDKSYYYVYRVGPGCCGNDGSMCGFEFTWDGIDALKENDWIEVTGKLRTYEETGMVAQYVDDTNTETTLVEQTNTYLTLDAVNVIVKPDSERGAENVNV